MTHQEIRRGRAVIDRIDIDEEERMRRAREALKRQNEMNGNPGAASSGATEPAGDWVNSATVEQGVAEQQAYAGKIRVKQLEEAGLPEQQGTPDAAIHHPGLKMQERAESATAEASAQFTHDTPMIADSMGFVPSEKHGPPTPDEFREEIIGSAVAVHTGNADSLTQEEGERLEKYANGSSLRQAVFGIMSDELYARFADKNHNELNNSNANALYEENFGLLGTTLGGYAKRLYEGNFPEPMLEEAFGAMLEVVEGAEKLIEADEEGIYSEKMSNACEDYLLANPEAKARLEKAFEFRPSDEMREGAAQYASEKQNEQRRKQDAWDACRAGTGTLEDLDIVCQEVEPLSFEEKAGDTRYWEVEESIRLERTLSDTSNVVGGWYNEMTLQYMQETGMGSDMKTVGAMCVKNLLADCEIDALEDVTAAARAMGYGSLEEYEQATGVDCGKLVRDMTMQRLDTFEREIATPEVVQTVREMTYGTGEVGVPEWLPKAIAAGEANWKAKELGAFYAWAESMNQDVDSARARALYIGKYGYVYAGEKLRDDLMDLAKQNYFPNKQINDFVLDYLEKGGDPFKLGMVPGDLSGVIEETTNANRRVEDLTAWRQENLTEEQAKKFDSVALATESGIEITSGVLSEKLIEAVVPGGLAYSAMKFLNTMAVNGSSSYLEGFERGMSEGLDMKESGMIALSHCLVDSMIQVRGDKRLKTRLRGMINAIDHAMEKLPAMPVLRWMGAAAKVSTAAATTATDTLVRESATDKFKGNVFNDAADAIQIGFMSTEDKPMRPASFSEHLLNAGRRLQGVNIFEEAVTVAEELPPTIELVAPLALVAGGFGGIACAKDIKNAMESGKAEDMHRAGQAIEKDMLNPQIAKAVNTAAKALNIASGAAYILAHDTGTIGQTMDEAGKKQETARQYKAMQQTSEERMRFYEEKCLPYQNPDWRGAGAQSRYEKAFNEAAYRFAQQDAQKFGVLYERVGQEIDALYRKAEKDAWAKAVKKSLREAEQMRLREEEEKKMLP